METAGVATTAAAVYTPSEARTVHRTVLRLRLASFSTPAKNQKTPKRRFFFMETAGVEPASENLFMRLSPGADGLLCFPLIPPPVRLNESVAF